MVPGLPGSTGEVQVVQGYFWGADVFKTKEVASNAAISIQVPPAP